MPHTIKTSCTGCESCQPQCPTGAIRLKDDQSGYWIDPTLCNDCEDLAAPQCVSACGVGSLEPLPAKKGRCKSTTLPAAIPDIFLSGPTTPFASSMVIWEACTVLAQRQGLPWQPDAAGCLSYGRSVLRGRGELAFRLATDPAAPDLRPLSAAAGRSELAEFDLRATCLHLIFAAYATTVERPWQTPFVLNNQHIEQYLGLEKRKDLTKLEKLTLIKTWVHQACQILVGLRWPRQGAVPGFDLAEGPVWHLQDTQYFFEEDPQGARHLIGLSFTVQAGPWAEHFLNSQGYRQQSGFYQYGHLPQSMLGAVMSHWQQHDGAMRIALWLLFKLRLGGDQRMTVRMLLRIAYGETRVVEATTVRGAHKRLLKTFECDLEMLHHYGLKPQFDPETYPAEIQPLWAKLARIPDDADAALEFWADDANQALSLTDRAPRDKWQRLLNARLLGFELGEDWQKVARRTNPKPRRRKMTPKPSAAPMSCEDIRRARQEQNLSQRSLAKRLGKSQSWIRDVEKGRFNISLADQRRLQQVLDLPGRG